MMVVDSRSAPSHTSERPVGRVPVYPASLPVRYLRHPACELDALQPTSWFSGLTVARWDAADRYAGAEPALSAPRATEPLIATPDVPEAEPTAPRGGPPELPISDSAPLPELPAPSIEPLPDWGPALAPRLWDLPPVIPSRTAGDEPHLWTAVPVADEVRPGKRRRLALVPLTLGIGALLAAGIAAFLILPAAFASRPATVGLFNAPMMVLRAASAGRISELGVSAGQAVDPATRLLTIHTDPPPDPAAAALRVRLDAVRSRVAALDAAAATPTPANDASRARLADLRQQRATAAADLTAAQDAVIHYTPREGADWPVLAGVHGIVRSLETQAGADIASGSPLIRLLDCDHAFVTLPEGADLRPGEPVGVRLPLLAPATATVRASSGGAEPRDSLVVPLAQAALGGACPVGAAATILPASELGRDKRS